MYATHHYLVCINDDVDIKRQRGHFSTTDDVLLTSSRVNLRLSQLMHHPDSPFQPSGSSIRFKNGNHRYQK